MNRPLLHHSIDRRTVVAGAGAAGLLAALTACSSGAASGGAGDGAKEVTFWGSWNSTQQVAQINKQVALFNKQQSKYKVTYVPQGLVEQKLLTGEASGKVPDVALWDRGQTSLYVSKGALESISPLVSKDKVDMTQFYSQPTTEMTVKGQLYGLPILVDDRSLFYNKKLLDEAGVKVPTNWSELQQAATTLAKSSGGKLTTAGFMLDDTGVFNMWLQQAGGNMLNAAGTSTAFNSAQGLEVLNFWKKLQDAGVYQQGFGSGSDAFAAGKAAMKYDGPWDVSTYAGVKNLDYGVAQPLTGPNGDKGTVTGGFGLVIPRGAKNVDGAWAFMKWWATEPASGVYFGKVAGWIPANKAAAQDPFFSKDPHYAAIVQALDYAKIRPTVAGYSDVEGKALIPALQKFMTGDLTAQQALKQAQQQGDQILAQNR